ncbi:lantibiotic dehydratase [Algibacter lectus]|uniref:lantibiotic dehydratase n=1 Tax=Algibacter lectus TaxID=221126 RepID=UPI0005A67758|nr:lantibiotic dehydratase [Algibacter lectus]
MTNIVLKKTEKFEKHVRVDMELVSIITDVLLSQNIILKKVKFYPNNSIHSYGNISSYIESEICNNQKTFFRSTFEEDIYISALLEFCEDGKLVFEIIQFLFNEFSIPLNESEDFIFDLIKNKILKSELEISTIDANPFKTLIHKLLKIEGVEIVSTLIKNGEILLKHFSLDAHRRTSKIVDDIELFNKTFNFLSFRPKDTFQIDLKGNTVINKLSIKTFKYVNNAINILNLFCNYQDDRLGNFKNAFYEKYEMREVPLLHALDDDFGFGYPIQKDKLLSDLLNDINFPSKEKKLKHKIFSKKDVFLLRKLSQFFLNNSVVSDEIELRITDEDIFNLKKLNQSKEKLPNTLAAFVELYSSSNNEEKVYINMFSASSSNLLGRFASSDKK